MTQDEMLEIFRRAGALLDGHFQLSSGLHSFAYLQCALALQRPEDAARFGAALAQQLDAQDVETVVSPAIGGLVIGYEVARSLRARFIWTERDQSGAMKLRRGFSLRAQERVLVIEDVITTGGSTLEAIDVVRAAGANVVAAGSIVDRSGGAAEVSVRRTALVSMVVETFEPASCPACLRGESVQKPGSRKDAV